MSPILNAAQAAELLCCSVRTIEDHARAGRIPGAKFGDGWVFAADLLVEAVKAMSMEQAARLKAPSQAAAVAVQPVAPKARGRVNRLPGLRLLPADVQAAVQQ